MAHSTDGNLPGTLDPRPPRLGRPPFWLLALAVVATVGSWVPLVFFARSRELKTDQPPVLMVQDMHIQPKYREQQASHVFLDGRADRPRVEGTVARGMLHEDEHYYQGWTKETVGGKAQVKFYDTFPAQVTVNDTLLARGQQRFTIYCTPCHGQDGYGDGMVNVRARELKQGLWVPPSNLTDALRRSRPVGHIFNTITVGIRNMPGYGPQIPVADRWAIVAYVRALQLSQAAPQDLIPPNERK